MNSNAGSLPSTLRIESMNTSKQTGAERPGKDFCTGKKSSLCLPLMSRAGGGSKQNLSAYSQTQFQLGSRDSGSLLKGEKKKKKRGEKVEAEIRSLQALSAGVAVCALLMLNVYTTFKSELFYFRANERGSPRNLECRRKQRQKNCWMEKSTSGTDHLLFSGLSSQLIHF